MNELRHIFVKSLVKSHRRGKTDKGPAAGACAQR